MFATIKNYAAILLQRFVEYIDSSLSSIVNASCDIINHIVSEPCPSVEELSKVYEFEATVETSLTILSILSIKINKRDDLLNKIALIFVEEKILSVRCIGCARLLLYLSYNYERVF